MSILLDEQFYIDLRELQTDFNCAEEEEKTLLKKKFAEFLQPSNIIKYLNLEYEAMVKITDFEKPTHGTYWLFIDGKWKKVPDFISGVQRILKRITDEIHTKTEINIDYLKISKEFIKYKVLPKSRSLKKFDPYKYLHNKTIPIFTKNKVYSIYINGDIDIEDSNCDNYNLWAIPHKIKDMPTPNWDKYLDFATKNRQGLKNIIQEMMGYCLTPLNVKHCFFFLIGEGRNGKGTLFEIIKQMVGEQSISRVPLESLNDTTKEVLCSTLVNLPTESGSSKINEEALKAISSGEEVHLNPKFKDPYQAMIVAKQLFSLNKLPYTEDMSRGFWDRVVVIPFDNTLKSSEQDPYYFTNIIKELPGIINFALKGLVRFANNKFTFSECTEIDNEKTKYKTEMNSMLMYIDDISSHFNDYVNQYAGNKNVKINKEKNEIEILRSKFYELYANFCKDSGYKKIPKHDSFKMYRNEGSKDKIREYEKSGTGWVVAIKAGKGILKQTNMKIIKPLFIASDDEFLEYMIN